MGLPIRPFLLFNRIISTYKLLHFFIKIDIRIDISKVPPRKKENKTIPQAYIKPITINEDFLFLNQRGSHLSRQAIFDMIKTVALSACCGQAPQELKDAADIVTCHCNNGAVADFLEYIESK